jgi:GR25 family glycosyltransferase involved in LPS biosynthesis
MQGNRINTFFSGVFLINLDRRPDRLEKVLPILDRAEFDTVMRFSAIEGKAIKYQGPLNAGQVGCTLSHLAIIRHAKEHKMESIFIIEDDVELADNFNEIVSNALEELPKDWCMFYAGGNHLKKASPHSEHLVKLSGTLTTHAYGIHSRFYDAIINTIESSFDKVIDVYYYQMHERYPSYCTNPKVAFQSAGFSDLEMRQVNYTSLNN